ncbi:hypothetical protein B0H66DRAFT_609953 [Apodospora peruviana]|uniref:Copper acquisition factor BIM1-like domain-containing protein n=1 Tax=Apodospora peruviana TaxID=516989 RepID=A0AAE0IRI1_9PEZI|nr:hypothetical protein B0H66DRAFT_609953 [Apodospora peruviana]
MTFIAVALLAAAQLATAHFGIEYPEWRANTLSGNTNYSQWVWPCANVPGNLPNGNRTDWPLTGGSVKLDLHHPWSYVFINLGLGENVTVFNYTLTPSLVNSTGNGSLCIPSLPLPADLSVSDGDLASIQVVTSGASGSALYNCADITFRANAKALSGDDCKSDEGVSFSVVTAEASNSTNNTSTPGGTNGNSASAGGVNTLVLTSVVGLAVAFVYGVGV